MSRLSKKPINIPQSVNVEYKDSIITAKGPMGSEVYKLPDGITLDINGQIINIVMNQNTEDKKIDAKAGLVRALVNNLLTGVTTGFEKHLEIVGVGYRATQQSKDVQFQLGYSHPIIFKAPDGIIIEVLEPTKLKVKGSNKQMVGQIASNIRELRPPEPYKGKGIRYKDEKVRRKAGKTGK
jgi:large subunit ribosomal protein L6